MGMEAPNTAQNTAFDVTEEHVDALLEAARYDDMDDLVSLASIGVPVDSKDSQGRTALHMAAANGHLDIVDYLISRGVLAFSGESICYLSRGFLFEHVWHLAEEFMQDVNSSNEEKNTPLHWACLNGHIEVVKTLILSGANVSVLNSYERTPMDEAVSRGKLQVMDAINEAVTQVELTGAGVST